MCIRDRRDGAFLHRAQQGVLLRFAEAMDLVDEEHGAAREEAASSGLFDHRAHVLHPAAYRAEGMEGTLQLLGDQPGECCLAHTRWSPKDK